MSTKQVEKFETLVEIPDGVTASINKYMLQVQGPLGKTFKNFKKIPVTIQVKDNKILINVQGLIAIGVLLADRFSEKNW